MPLTERQVREQAAVKDKILAAARRLFVQHGYEAVSLRKIAETIGYTAPAIYTHFSDKSQLLAEICRRDFGALASVFLSLSRVKDPVDRIYRIGLTYIRFAREHPEHYRLMFMTPHLCELAPPSPEDLRAMNDPEQDAYAYLLQTVKQAIQEGCFRPEHSDAELITQTLWAAVHGVASLEVTHGDCQWVGWRGVDRRARTMCRTMLRGFLKDPSRLEGTR